MQECRHKSTEELMTDKELRKLEREMWPYKAVEQSHGITDEVRHSRLFTLRGDMETVSVGLPRHERFEGEVVNLSRSTMPSQGGRDVRSSAYKVERAAMYNVRGAKGSRTSQVVNYEELEKALASLGGR